MDNIEKTIQEKIEKMYKDTVENIKQHVENFSPQPIKDMLNTEAGTYFLISVVVILLISFLRFVGGVLNFIFKVILLIATLSAIFFALVYFFGEYFKFQ